MPFSSCPKIRGFSPFPICLFSLLSTLFLTHMHVHYYKYYLRVERGPEKDVIVQRRKECPDSGPRLVPHCSLIFLPHVLRYEIAFDQAMESNLGFARNRAIDIMTTPIIIAKPEKRDMPR